jgi:hypothetical protein
MHAAANARRRAHISCRRHRRRHFHHFRAVGAAASTRQVLLHILPGDKGFGSPLLGLHLYTWCLIAFIAQIAASAVMLIGAAWLKEQPVRWQITNVTAVAFIVIVTANLISVIAEAGFNWDLPSDPVGYLLLR